MKPIELALAALDLSDEPNYAAVAKEFKVSATTLAHRHKGTQLSHEDATFQHKTLLSKQQNKDLLDYVNKLTVRGCPPTPAMVRNFAFDICKTWPGKNWVAKW